MSATEQQRRELCEDKMYPLTAMQQDLYLDSVLHPESFQNSLGYAVEINSPMNVELWESVIQKMHDSQSALRMQVVLDEDAGVACQQFLPDVKIKLNVVDLKSHKPGVDEVNAKIAEITHRNYDVVGGDLIHYYLLALSNRHFVFVVAAHHVLIDGIGFAAHLSAICQNYENAILSQPLDFGQDLFPQHIDYSQRLFDTPNVEAFWKKKFSNVVALDVQGFSGGPEKEVEKGAEEESVDKGLEIELDSSKAQEDEKLEKELLLSDEHWSAIRGYCRSNKITPAHYFKCLYGLLLNQYCNPHSDFYINELASGRPKGHGSAIGLYFHQIPFVFPREKLSQESTMAELISYAKEFQKGLGDNKYISISKQFELSPKAETRFMYNFIGFYPAIDFLGQQERLHPVMNDVYGQVQFVPKVIDGKCHLHLIYFQSTFDDLDFLHRVESLSQQLVDGTERFGDLDMLLPNERKIQTNFWNDTDLVRADVSSVQQLFEAQVDKAPDAEALVFEGEVVSYRELNSRANKLAKHICLLGVMPGDLVALCLDRSIEMVVSILAVLKSGAAYVPMDPELPGERLSYILADTNAKILITQALLNGMIPSKSTQVVCVDSGWVTIDALSGDNLVLDATVTSDALFNVIYTSGSTGNPKGVMVPHKGIINRIQWMQEAFQLTADDRVLQKTPYSFDVSVWEFIWPLIAGSSLVIAKPNGHVDTEYLVNLIKVQAITTIHFVPSMLNIFLQLQSSRQCDSLARVFCSGEALSESTVVAFFETFDTVELHNLYGPTEASIDVSHWQCKKGQHRGSVPIGKPIANIKLHILGGDLDILPTGVIGELYIEGVGLARGYLNLPERTEQSFITGEQGSEWEGRRLYRTGDLARFRRDGNIEFLGRADHQVKIRGYRIEMGEIETALKKHNSVSDVVVSTRGVQGDDLHIVAYVVGVESSLSVHEIRGFLKEHIPAYMIPAEFFLIDSVPLTANGKVNRKALLSCEEHLKQNKEFVPPRNDTEQALAKLWCDVLKVEEVGAFDNFFDLGGHSLIATQLVSRIRKQFDVSIGVAHVFNLDNLAEQALFIDTARIALQDYDSGEEGSVEIEI